MSSFIESSCHATSAVATCNMSFNDEGRAQHHATRFETDKANIKRLLAFFDAPLRNGTDFALCFEHLIAAYMLAQLRKNLCVQTY